MDIIILSLIIVLGIANFGAELWRDLMMLQQNSYRRERYSKWLSQSGDTTSGWRLCGITVFLIALTPWCPALPGAVLAGIFCIFNTTRLLRAKYKKPLVMTARARRIYATAWVLTAIACGIVLLLVNPGWSAKLHAAALALLGAYCGSHIIILAANTVLDPVEKTINRSYINEAKSILAQMPGLKIIGVTGSYGKTTTKHYLFRILSEQYETLMTPGSYNTPLGVVRTIRELLKPFHEVFIVEMGAKNLGDIKEICDIVHPRAGIITAVGPQHLESFKTIENVQRTKFELADALPADGLAVVNNDFEMIACRQVDNVRCIRYAVKNTDGADYIATNIGYSPAGTKFTVKNGMWSIDLSTRIVGECNVSNILAAVAMAHEMGVADDKIKYAVAQIEQVEHRLSIKRIPGSLTIIDDAFNSNPVGSAMALEVLASMTEGKRILITPGMIELGERQQELNEEFGFKAASSCDIAIVVGEYNREAIVAGLERGSMPRESIRTADSFAQAQSMLQSLAQPGDIVLYENDLPDTFK